VIEDYLQRPWVVAQLRDSVLGQDLDALTDELASLGYRITSIQNHLHAAGHLAYWLERRRLKLDSLDEAIVRRFVKEHLPRCRCPIPRGNAPDVGGVAPHLLRLLRARGRIGIPLEPTATAVDNLLAAFATHLKENRGASSATCERNVRDVRLLLQQTYGDGPIEIARLTPGVLRSFVAERTARCSTRTGRRTASALRSFIRSLHLQGITDGQLIQAVPTVRDTRRSTLPTPLTSAQLQKLLTSIDQKKRAGLRDYAMIMCLTHLGLRAKEVADLTLDDIDWRAGTVTIRSSKVRRTSVLPLPKPVGRAIMTYLRKQRPATSARQVFVRWMVPVGRPLRSANVTCAVQKAFKRSGLNVPSQGAHTLRHTVATEMVRAGVSLKEIADVLRHRSIDTTAIYTKVDLPRLREVALPWPEVEP
jgi:site-specific recombinase XerD